MKEFSTVLEWSGPHIKEAHFNFFTVQTEIEKIRLLIVNSSCPSILFHVLNFSPKLKEFEYHTINLYFNVEEFHDFLMKTHQLESLSIPSIKCNFASSCLHDLQPQLPGYMRLKKLRLEGDMDNWISFEILNQCCMSLQYLSINSVDEWIMHKVLESHVRFNTD